MNRPRPAPLPDTMSSSPHLEHAHVRFPAGFARRLERLAAADLRARGERDSRAGRRSEARGVDFAGHRAYRPGEDVRHLDWALLARLDRPFVREHARAAGERWMILLDTSGSMGLGEPGKLSAAAALAVGLAVVGARRGARTGLIAARTGAAPLTLEFERAADLTRWIAALGALRAERGATGSPAWSAPRTRCERVVALSDLQGLDLRLVSRLRRPGRRVGAVAFLAPHERTLPPGDAARLVDRESGASLELALAPSDRARWVEALADHLEQRRAGARAAGVEWHALSSAAPFEDGVRALLDPWP